MCAEIIVKCNNGLLLKMGTPPSLSSHNVVGHKHGKNHTSPSQLQHGREGRKEVHSRRSFEAGFADKDSDNENLDCGSDAKFVPDSEDDSACEESDLADSTAMPHSSYSQDVENVSRNLSGIHFCVLKLKKSHFLQIIVLSELETCF